MMGKLKGMSMATEMMMTERPGDGWRAQESQIAAKREADRLTVRGCEPAGGRVQTRSARFPGTEGGATTARGQDSRCSLPPYHENSVALRLAAQAFQSPCRLQNSRADTGPSPTMKVASGAASGLRCWRWTLSPACTSIHSM
jgi:hypothetical protein